MQQIGLRERKKQRTRETIARTALKLFDRHGFQATTIPQIADAAEVSPRTVSTYFPAKEELVFPDQEESFAQLAERVRERPAGETAPEALRAWVQAQLPSWQAREDELQMRGRVIDADEGLRTYRTRFVVRTQELMADEIAHDLGRAPGDPETHMAAAATSAMLDVLAQHRPASGGDLAAWHGEALELMDRAVLFVNAGIRALRVPPGGGRAEIVEDGEPPEDPA
jgi:AcrR family transcriptional regulator